MSLIKEHRNICFEYQDEGSRQQNRTHGDGMHLVTCKRNETIGAWRRTELYEIVRTGNAESEGNTSRKINTREREI